MSIFKKAEYFEVNYDHLNKFIAEKYNLPSFKGTLESSNDSEYTYIVSKSEPDSFDKNDLKRILKDQKCTHYELRLVLDDLCRNGHIEPGQYLVDVYW